MKTQTYVNRSWIIFLSFSIILTFVLIYIEHSRSQHIESRIDTINDNFRKLVVQDSTLLDNIKFIQFKEDAYLKQLDRDTNQILWFVAIVFGLFGVLSYSSFNRRVQIVEENLEDKFEKALAELTKLKDDLYDVQADLESESATINDQVAENHYKEGRFDYYLFYSLLSINKKAGYYEHNASNEAVSSSYLSSILSSLNYLNVCLKELELKPKISEDSYLNATFKIRRIHNIEVIGLLSETFALIEIDK